MKKLTYHRLMKIAITVKQDIVFPDLRFLVAQKIAEEVWDAGKSTFAESIDAGTVGVTNKTHILRWFDKYLQDFHEADWDKAIEGVLREYFLNEPIPVHPGYMDTDEEEDNTDEDKVRDSFFDQSSDQP